jgi:KRAB domain-containing zinc finger protein
MKINLIVVLFFSLLSTPSFAGKIADAAKKNDINAVQVEIDHITGEHPLDNDDYNALEHLIERYSFIRAQLEKKYQELLNTVVQPLTSFQVVQNSSFDPPNLHRQMAIPQHSAQQMPSYGGPFMDVGSTQTTTNRNRSTDHVDPDEETKYKCTIAGCGFETKYRNALKLHISTHTGEKPYACETCSYRTASWSNLKRHLLTHSDEKPYVCQICGYQAARPDYLDHHLSMHNRDDSHVCQTCGFLAATKGSLKMHIRVSHGARTVIQSSPHPMVDQNSSINSVNLHQQIAIPQQSVQHTSADSGPSMYTSSTQTTGKRKRSTDHVDPTAEVKYKCTVKGCEFETVHASSLSRHKIKHTDKKPYACEICSYRASQSGNLKKHLLSHSDENRYACEICSYRAATKHDLWMHTLTHPYENSYPCQTCGFLAATKKGLKMHITTTHGVRSVTQSSSHPMAHPEPCEAPRVPNDLLAQVDDFTHLEDLFDLPLEMQEPVRVQSPGQAPTRANSAPHTPPTRAINPNSLQ